MKQLLYASLLVPLLACTSDEGEPDPRIDLVQSPDAAPQEIPSPADARIGPPDATAAAPRFVQPITTGATLDLRSQACIDVDIAVADLDSGRVVLRQDAPVIQGATLVQTSDLTATWSWCPTATQIAYATEWRLALSAADGDFAPVTKDYVITLKRP